MSIHNTFSWRDMKTIMWISLISGTMYNSLSIWPSILERLQDYYQKSLIVYDLKHL